jgi:hypothetical protein
VRKELRHRIYPQALRLALVMVQPSDSAIRIARRAVREVLAEGARIPASPHTEVLAAVRRMAPDRPSTSALSGDERLARAVSELIDGQGLNHRVVARSLGVTTDEVERLHRLAQIAAGIEPAAPPRCSGWSLVRRMDELSAFEATAAQRHLGLCRECRDAQNARFAARSRLRKAIPIGGGGLLAAGGVAGSLAIGGAVAGVVVVGMLATSTPAAEIGDPVLATRSTPAAVVIVADVVAPTPSLAAGPTIAPTTSVSSMSPSPTVSPVTTTSVPARADGPTASAPDVVVDTVAGAVAVAAAPTAPVTTVAATTPRTLAATTVPIAPDAPIVPAVPIVPETTIVAEVLEVVPVATTLPPPVETVVQVVDTVPIVGPIIEPIIEPIIGLLIDRG